mgnify:CR=1 FL=1
MKQDLSGDEDKPMKGTTHNGKIQKIIVDNSEYMWLFRYDGYDYQNFPYLLITAKAFPKATLHINFPIKEHFLLNSGLPAVFQGQRVSIKLEPAIVHFPDNTTM